MRRSLALLTLSALAMGGAIIPTNYAHAADSSEITVLATTDVHGNVFNWDYFRNQAFSDKAGHAYGLAQAGCVIDKVRSEKGAESVAVVDNGDTLQGTPLAYYAAKIDPITTSGATHPMAAAYNALGYDAQVVGNHEFNYGLDLAKAYQKQLDFPLTGANVVDATTGKPVFEPYTMVTKKTADGTPVKIAFVGLTTPGSMIWDKTNLEGKVEIEDMVSSAKKWVPQAKAAGADVVVVMSHAGMGQSSYATANLGPENPADKIAEQVPGIDAMVIGHTHQDVPKKVITNATTGKNVTITQPRYWASSVSELTFDLTRSDGAWTLNSVDAAAHYTKDCTTPNAKVSAAVKPMHDKAVAYVNEVIATSTAELSAATSRYEDTAILDYIQMVQTQAVTEGLKGSQYADLPVLSIAAPFSRTAVFPKGDVTVRDMAGLYIYDNTLQAVTMTGAEVKDYLEYSAKYFGQVPAGGTFDPETMTSVTVNGQQVWDYNYDIISGMSYKIDLSQPVGSRIVDMKMADGSAVKADQKFVVAVNNYRRSGGGNFPHIATAPKVYDQNLEIRQLLIDWAQQHKVIDAKDFFEKNWELVWAGKEGYNPSTPAPSGKPSTPAASGKPSTPAASGKPSTPAASGKPSTPVASGKPGNPGKDNKPGKDAEGGLADTGR